MSEVQMYAMHITQKNKIEDIMNEEIAKILKEYNAAMTPMSIDPMKYVATILFRTKEERAECCLKLYNRGVDIAPDSREFFADTEEVTRG